MNKTASQIIKEQKEKGLLIRLSLDKLKGYVKEFDKERHNDKVLNEYNLIFINGVVLQIFRDEEELNKIIEEKEVLS